MMLTEIEESRGAPTKHVVFGKLSKIISKRAHPSRDGLVWNNLYFTTSNRNRVTIPEGFHAENAPLSLRPELLDELSKYIKVSDAAKKAYTKLAQERRNEREKR